MNKTKAYRKLVRFAKENKMSEYGIRLERTSYIDNEECGIKWSIWFMNDHDGYGSGDTFDLAFENMLKNKKRDLKSISDGVAIAEAEARSIERIEKITGKSINQIA